MMLFKRKKQPTPYELAKKESEDNRLAREKTLLADMTRRMSEDAISEALDVAYLVESITSKHTPHDLKCGIVLSDTQTLRFNNNPKKHGLKRVYIERGEL